MDNLISDNFISILIDDNDGISIDVLIDMIYSIPKTVYIKDYYTIPLLTKTENKEIYKALNFRKCKYGTDAWKYFNKGVDYYRANPEELDNAVQKYIASIEQGQDISSIGLIPTDFSHVAQARILAREYNLAIKHSKETDFLVYNGKVWESEPEKAKLALHELTDRQLEEARNMILKAEPLTSKNEITQEMVDENQKRKAAMQFAEAYEKYIKTCRNNNAISGVLSQIKPMVHIKYKELDVDPFLLNTPDGTVCLKTGKMKPHDPADFCTKITAVSPSDKGMDIWLEFLDTITCQDKDFEKYIQLYIGMSIMGKVTHEYLAIAHGKGANGKSTLFNTIGQVLGDYFGTLPPEALLANPKGNKDYSTAQLRGKRFVVAAETEESKRLSEAQVKKVSSKDIIKADQKYKDEIEFKPSHNIVLYTNWLPNVNSLDNGTWRRLLVFPFRHTFEGGGDRKDYAEYLYENASGAILQWAIEGAKEFIASGYKLEQPDCVKEAIGQYKGNNDWIGAFIDECCEIGEGYEQKAGAFYSRYKAFCIEKGEFVRKDSDFKAALLERKYKWRRTRVGAVYYGVRVIKSDDPDGEGWWLR